MYIGPGMTGDWLFIAGYQYWLKFRPNVTSTLTVIDSVPAKRNVAITALARRDTADHVRTLLTKHFPNAYLDLLVYDYLADMQLTLDGRAALNQRLGVPESQDAA
jgi:hypothetical protein